MVNETPNESHLAKLLLENKSFLKDVGLNEDGGFEEFQPEKVTLLLEMEIGFILAMYNAAKWIFTHYTAMTLDDKLVRLIYSRVVLFPNFSQVPFHLADKLDQEAFNYAKACYADIRRKADESQCKWDNMPLYSKFFEICVHLDIKETKADLRSPHKESNSAEHLKVISSPLHGIGTRSVFAGIFKGIFSHINWDIDKMVNEIPNASQLAKLLLEKRGFPNKFVKGLREILGDEKFTSLTLLCKKYYLFDQAFFSNPHSFKDINNEMINLRVAAFLSNVANDLCKRHILDAGEKLSQIVLTLRPKYFPARMTLALICCESGRFSEAREYAQRAIIDMDSFDEEYKDIPIPEYIANPKHLADLRAMLHSIPDKIELFKKYMEGQAVPKEQKEAIDGLDEILKHLFAILLVRYRTIFPADPAHTIALRAGVVLNELVVENLRGDQVEFRRANTEFADREKREVMMLEEVRKGVLDFLAAKGGLYLSWGHQDADTWISEAKKIDTDIDIPNTLEEVRETIKSCLTWYQQHS